MVSPAGGWVRFAAILGAIPSFAAGQTSSVDRARGEPSGAWPRRLARLAARGQLVEAPLGVLGALAMALGGAGGALEAILELLGLLGVDLGLTRMALGPVLVLRAAARCSRASRGSRACPRHDGVSLLLMARQLPGDDLALTLDPGLFSGPAAGEHRRAGGDDDQDGDDDEDGNHGGGGTRS